MVFKPAGFIGFQTVTDNSQLPAIYLAHLSVIRGTFSTFKDPKKPAQLTILILIDAQPKKSRRLTTFFFHHVG